MLPVPVPRGRGLPVPVPRGPVLPVPVPRGPVLPVLFFRLTQYWTVDRHLRRVVEVVEAFIGLGQV